MKKLRKKQSRSSKILAKENVRSVHGMLSTEAAVSEELIQERKRDKHQEGMKLKKRSVEKKRI